MTDPRTDPEPLPSVTVVLPTAGRAARLPQVVTPLLDDPGVHEVLVVDDSTKAETRDVLAALDRGDGRLVVVTSFERNVNGARDVGTRAASGDVVLHLDDDVRAELGLALVHARRHAGTTKLVVLGHMPVAKELREAAGHFPGRLYNAAYEQHVELWQHSPEQILQHFWAGHFSVRRADALAVGLRSPEYIGKYHSDFYLGTRLSAAGFRATYEPSARSTHLYERSPEQFLLDARRQGASHVLGLPEGAGGLGEINESFYRSASRPLKLLLRAHDTSAVRSLLHWAGRRVLPALGRPRTQRLQTKAAFLFKRLNNRAGAVAVRRGNAEDEQLVRPVVQHEDSLTTS